MAKAAKPKTAAADKAAAEAKELQIIYSGYDALNGLVEATKKEVLHHRKGLCIKCDSTDMVKKVFDECIADSQTF